MHIENFPVLVTTPAQLESAFARLGHRVQALFIAPQIFFAVHVRRVAELLALARLPAIYQARLFADAGGLMSYGPNYRIVFANTAHYVDKILKGAKPADLPVEQPTEYELVINLKTAKALGITIPESILLRANEVIR